jgi:hypothetical protein
MAREGTERNDHRWRLQYFLCQVGRRAAPAVTGFRMGRVEADAAARCPYQLRALRHNELELLLVRARQGGNSRQRTTQSPKNAEAALDPIGADGVRDGEQIATRITNFGSFHGAILKQRVGHRLSHGKK